MIREDNEYDVYDDGVDEIGEDDYCEDDYMHNQQDRYMVDDDADE